MAIAQNKVFAYVIVIIMVIIAKIVNINFFFKLNFKIRIRK